MSSKTTTTTSNAYNPAGMNNYNQFQGPLGQMLTQYAQNPLGSSFFNQQYGMAKNQASQIGQRNISNVLNNARTGGGILGNSGAFLQNQLNKTNLGNSALQTGAFQNTLNSALNNQKWALSSMQGYTPLQTGQQSVQQQQQGLGSIFGSLAGVGLNMAMPGLGSMLGGNSFSAGYNPGGYGYTGTGQA